MTTGVQENVTRFRCVGGGVCGVGGGTGGSGGRGLGGRPRRGGIAASMSGGEWHAFRRSVETLSVLFPICSLKLRRLLSNTRYGPS